MSRKVNENKFSSKFELLCTKTLSQEIHWSSSESEELEPNKPSRKLPLRPQLRKSTSSRKKPSHSRKSLINNLEVSFTQHLIDRPKSPILTGSKRLLDEITLSPPPSPILKMRHDYPTWQHSDFSSKCDNPKYDNSKYECYSKHNNCNSTNIRSCELTSPILKSKISPTRSIIGTSFRKRLKLDDISNRNSKSMVNSDKMKPFVNTKSLICQDNVSDIHVTSYTDRNEGRTSPILSTKLDRLNSNISDRTFGRNETLSTNDSHLKKSPIFQSQRKNEYRDTNIFTATNSKIKEVNVSGGKSIFNKLSKSSIIEDRFEPLGKEYNETVEGIRILPKKKPYNLIDNEDKEMYAAYKKHAVMEAKHTSPILNTTTFPKTSTNKDSNRSDRKSPILTTILKKSTNKSHKCGTNINTSLEKIVSHSKSKEIPVLDNKASEPRMHIQNDEVLNSLGFDESFHSQLSDNNGSKIDLIANQDIIPSSHGIPKRIAVENHPKPIPNQPCPKVNLIQKVNSFFDAQFSSQSASQNSIQETQSSHCQTSESPVIDLEVSPETKSDSDVIVLESDNDKSSFKEVADLSSRSIENVRCKGRVMRKKYKKGGLADRLQNLVCKQNAAVSLWKHEQYLAENTGFVVPVNNFRLFKIIKCSFDFNITLLHCLSLDTDENYFIVLNNLVTKNLVICENSMLKLFEPFFELDVRVNEYRVIVNACKFQLIDVIKKESDL